ncbi:MAG: permease-like cell division protein FtsX [Dysgonamonadaceae bacterium]|jgi:cell division transport system permease protein|nr:permease-like cell division protein FtsX [Dysgonamonadaceae bacterium]
MKSRKKITPTAFYNSKITAIISISLVLFLLGLVVLLSLFANNFSTYVKENLSFDIVLNDDMSDAQIKKLQNTLHSTSYVKSVKFISKEDAASQLEKDLGQSPEELLGFNPLPAMLEVKLNSEYATTDSIAVIEKSVRSMSANIQEVQYHKDLIRMVNENMKKIGLIILGLATLLLFISYALISNTIRLMIYSKRFLIHTMRLVGATNSFITKPFVYSNILSGIIAAFIAIGLIVWLLYYIAKDVIDFTQLIDTNSLIIVFVSVLVFGVLISVVATWLAVNKYLRMPVDDMYYE